MFDMALRESIAGQLPDFIGNHFDTFFRVYVLVFLNRVCSMKDDMMTRFEQ
jgi:hypothetical protein